MVKIAQMRAAILQDEESQLESDLNFWQQLPPAEGEKKGEQEHKQKEDQGEKVSVW